MLTCHFLFDERKKCKRSSQKVCSTDTVSATEFSKINEIDNTEDDAFQWHSLTQTARILFPLDSNFFLK